MIIIDIALPSDASLGKYPPGPGSFPPTQCSACDLTAVLSPAPTKAISISCE